VKLNAADKDSLYDARINPIATFPRIGPGGTPGYVIFGQKTLQQARSALDRVNVRRMLLEVKRQVVAVANNFVFEQNTPALRKKFVAQVTPLLATVQAQSGIEKFKVVMDDTNNSQADIESNKLNGRIVLVPTRAIEFVSLDFVITNAGVSFEE
jgi:phage tail sheath protein FI